MASLDATAAAVQLRVRDRDERRLKSVCSALALVRCVVLLGAWSLDLGPGIIPPNVGDS